MNCTCLVNAWIASVYRLFGFVKLDNDGEVALLCRLQSPDSNHARPSTTKPGLSPGLRFSSAVKSVKTGPRRRSTLQSPKSNLSSTLIAEWFNFRTASVISPMLRACNAESEFPEVTAIFNEEACIQFLDKLHLKSRLQMGWTLFKCPSKGLKEDNLVWVLKWKLPHNPWDLNLHCLFESVEELFRRNGFIGNVYIPCEDVHSVVSWWNASISTLPNFQLISKVENRYTSH